MSSRSAYGLSGPCGEDLNNSGDASLWWCGDASSASFGDRTNGSPYVHINPCLLQFVHVGCTSSHLTLRALHRWQPVRDLVCAKRGAISSPCPACAEMTEPVARGGAVVCQVIMDRDGG